VPELTELVGAGCNITLSAGGHGNSVSAESWYFDSAFSQYEAAGVLMQIGNEASRQGRQPEKEVCAVIGPRGSFGGSLAVTANWGTPQITYAPMEGVFSLQTDEYPLYTSLVPHPSEFADIIPKYLLRDVWQRGVYAVLSDDTPIMEKFETALEDAADTFDEDIARKIISVHFVQSGDNAELEQSLETIRSSGYRTIVLVTDQPNVIPAIAAVAEEKGLLGSGYFWILAGDALSPAFISTLKFEVDTPPDKLLRGASVFRNIDPFFFAEESDPFLKAWRKQNSSLVDILNAVQPLSKNGEKFYIGDSSYFQEEAPAEYASFMYDAVMATGIAACTSRGATSGEHFRSILSNSFTGASGYVRFEEAGNGDPSFNRGREAEGPYYGFYNIRAESVDDANMRR